MYVKAKGVLGAHGDHGAATSNVTETLAGALAAGLMFACFKRNTVIILSLCDLPPKRFFFFRKL